MWLVGIGAESPAAIGFILREVPLKPHDIGLVFEGQDVGGDPVEEPSIVTDDDGATWEGEETVFECPKRVDI